MAKSKIRLYKSNRRLIQFFFTLIIILVPFLNIIRLDVPTLRFYFFNSVLWVEEFYFLFLFLMLFTWIILTFSMIYGRVWCGWMCPQMTMIDFTAWIRRTIRKVFRIKQIPGIPGKILETGLTSIFTLALSILIGFNLVAYFVDPYRIIKQFSNGTLDPITLIIISAIAIILFVDMMVLRETFCTKACPYAMFQMVITDKKTQIVLFYADRKDECIDCRQCVKVCTMGIDIRESPFQTECTHCGDCVDACTNVMSKLTPPSETLIAFSWGDNKNNLRQKISFFAKIGLFDIKRWALVSLAIVFFSVLIILSQVRETISISISGDRSTLYLKGESGEIINKYILKITNRGIEDEIIDLIAPDLILYKTKTNKFPLSIEAGKTIKVYLSVSHSANKLKQGPNRLLLEFNGKINKDNKTRQEIVFFMPEDFKDSRINKKDIK